MKFLKSMIEELENETTVRDEEDFVQLFKEHAARLKQNSLTASKIRTENPALLTKIHVAVRAADAAWIRGDLEGFKCGLQRIEDLYGQALAEVCR